MNFNNTNNRCTLTGYICSDFLYNDKGTSLEFRMGVERKADVIGGKNYTDYFTVFVCKRQIISLLQTLGRKGCIITVKGEIRNWADNTIKICAEVVTIKA